VALQRPASDPTRRDQATGTFGDFDELHACQIKSRFDARVLFPTNNAKSITDGGQRIPGILKTSVLDEPEGLELAAICRSVTTYAPTNAAASGDSVN
jgi:hypothetical protein